MMPEVIESIKLEAARGAVADYWFRFGKELADGFFEGLFGHDDIYAVNWDIFNGRVHINIKDIFRKIRYKSDV